MKMTLRTKLIVFVVALAVLITCAMTVGSYLQMRNQLIDVSIKNEITNAAADTSRLIKSWIDVRMSIVTAGVENLSKADDPLPGIVQTAKSGLFQAAYLGTTDKRMIGDHDLGIPPGFDPTHRPWYVSAVAANGTTMAPPYVDVSTHKLVLSFAGAVRKNGNLIGVLGTDTLLDDIVKNVLGINLSGEGFAMLMGKDGQVLVYKDAERINKPVGDLSPDLSATVLADLAASGQVREVQFDSGVNYFYVQAVPGADLYLAVAVNKASALAPLNGLVLRAGLTLLVLILLILPLAGLQISHMLSGMRRIHDAMQEISEGGGDLTRKIDIQGVDEIASTARAFNRFLDILRNMFQEIRHETARLTTGVNEINQVIGKLSRDTQALSNLTAENAAAIEEITVSISHIADHTNDADQLVKNTGALSSESAHSVQVVADDVGRSAREVEGLSSLLNGLSQRSQEISGIIRVIKDIADQTNLLALNAAIEAARAGEQGRGFAVVADEVRKLAERTGQATVQITGMIEGMTSEMGTAVSDMHRTLQTVQTGAGASGETAGKIASIRENMDAVVNKMEEIALSTREQLAATTAMAQSAERITGQMQGSDEALHQASAAVHQLNELAQNLEKMFSNFKL
ncbi:methyl-accepting chemotaxis protein [Paludibacterium purpuratum]|nr:methyl-accepting chemotaxis protein [Paludibacterium purpuratum]